MENQNNNPQQPQDENWLDEILGSQELTEELGPDEQAIAAAGLTDPAEVELERILQEAKAGEFENQPLPEALPQQDTEATQFFVPPEVCEPLPEQEAEMAAPEGEKNAPEDAQPVRKRRPQMKKGYGLFGIPHILATGVWLAIILAIGISMGRVLWVCAADILAFGKEPQQVTITISENDDLEVISQKLQKAGLIRYPGLFQFFADFTGKGEKITPGTFVFNKDMSAEKPGIAYDYNALVNRLVDYGPSQNVVKVTFPEGSNCAQIFALLEEKGVCTVEALEEYAANGALDEYWFLEGVERGHKYCLEGYLAPDTYEFYTNEEDPSVVLEKFLDEFDDRMNDRLKQKFVELNQTLSEKMAANGYGSDYIAEHQLTMHDVVIMASIVEKETANNAESFDIAAVFYNRLTNQSKYPWLNSDATMVYAEKYYYKDELLTEEDRNSCEFNTYVYRGLIPKPIANPSLNSLAAALDPRFAEDAVYYYFVYDEEEGCHRFSETEAEHLQWIKELGLSDE